VTDATPAAAAVDLFDDDFFARAQECTVEAWLSFLGHRWSALILYHLSLGPKRFNEIAACLPTATHKVLSERLAALQTRGLVDREPPPQGGPYRLSPLGQSLMPILHGLEVWARH
jgi:DNA-binding HxlR family transcriptional regulator